jgi:hypothetical protein
MSVLSRPASRFAVCALIAATVLSWACGSSVAKSNATATTSPATAAGGAAGHGNRTPQPAVQTSIAQGTPRPDFGDGAPGGRLETAIAEGTPADAVGRGFGGPGGFGGGRALTAAATLLGIDETQLRSELQTSGATIASVAAAHGLDRATLRQGLIEATRQRLAARSVAAQ